MNNEEIRALCMQLIQADSEQEVIQYLETAGLWNREEVWRHYADYENNFNSIGNQQSSSDSALVEKIINAVDARLMNECWIKGINPESPEAPQTIGQAVAWFFDEKLGNKSAFFGNVKDWSDKKRTEVAKGITVAATGFRSGQGNPCITIADCGEGQTPLMMPKTFLSLTQSNKLRIPFVQGKFNMGGTGVLKFCGKSNLQLIVSRRNPVLINKHTCDPTELQWGFTIVRRLDPTGNRRSSVYEFLAPIKASTNKNKGEVFSFTSQTMPLFPNINEPYKRETEWGSLIKLYEYSGYKSHILLKDGLLRRVDLLLPQIALPVRFYECRKGFRGGDASYETTLNGLLVRLEDDKGNNMETDGFPSSFSMDVGNERLSGTIYAFKKEKAQTYRKDEGIIFMLNGQTHGNLSPAFFKRTSLGLSYLADSLLVILDCSEFSGRAREDLFMNSRDRLSSGDLKKNLEKELEDLLKHHEGLRALKDKRRREAIAEKLNDTSPLESVLENMLKKYPTLETLFIRGEKLKTPFKSKSIMEADTPFKGKRYPTYFRFKDKAYGQTIKRECHKNMRCRIAFETDADNDYFSRDIDKGNFKLLFLNAGQMNEIQGYTISLFNGIATLSIQMPESCKVGEILEFKAVATDSTQINDFENPFVVTVKDVANNAPGSGNRHKSTSNKNGNDRDIPAGIALPAIIPVYEEEWVHQSPPFDKYSALRVLNVGDDSEEGSKPHSVYDFYVNMDNIYLKNELKISKMDVRILEARFKYALVLIGLALLQEHLAKAEQQEKGNTSDDPDGNGDDNALNIEDKIEQFTQAVATVILPMINELGEINEDEIA